jgi:Domain of Unknown Function (DUF326)
MHTVEQMLQSYPKDLGGIDIVKLTECIQACFECAQTCTACADACPASSRLVRPRSARTKSRVQVGGVTCE